MRPRNPENRGLPQNLYFTGQYGFYRHPETGITTGMGTDRDAAIRAAKRLNEQLSIGDQAELLVRRVLGQQNKKSWGQHLDYMTGTGPDGKPVSGYWPDKRIDGRPLSAKTLHQYKLQCDRFKKHFGEHRDPDTIGIGDVAKFLEPLPPRTRNLLRGTLMVIFRVAIAEGVRSIKDNPAEATLKADYSVMRQRLTLDTFIAIRAESGPIMQRAMDIAIQTLQREEDIVALQWLKPHHHKSTLGIDKSTTPYTMRVVQQKTKAHIEIEVRAPLDRIIDSCKDDKVASNYVLHYPLDVRPRWRSLIGKPLSTNWIQDEFAAARDAALKKHPELFVVVEDQGKTRPMVKGEFPTFHEIRSLGKKLYNDRGMDVNDLAGWEEDSDMPKLYSSRHEPEWRKAIAGLEL